MPFYLIKIQRFRFHTRLWAPLPPLQFPIYKCASLVQTPTLSLFLSLTKTLPTTNNGVFFSPLIRVPISPPMNPMSVFRGHPTNAISIAKIAAVLIAGAAAAFAVARFAFPYFVEALTSSFPSLWSFLRVWLVPPYLFITVHVIIAAIWKLSDQKLHRNHNEKNHAAVKPLDLSLDRDIAPLKAVSKEIVLGPDVTSPICASESAESCMTTDSEENTSASSRFDFEKSEKEEAMDLVDTWETIVMKKSATWERSSETAAVAADFAGERVVKRSVTFQEPPVAAVDGTDELNRRFEAFIKKNYDQIRSY